jgi:epidermal growth factor receptor substrate 15
MATPFSPTQGELALVNQIFSKHDPQKYGVITGDVALRIFGGTNLNTTILGQIWGFADVDNQGFLTRKGVSVAVRLVGWAQKGEAVSADLVNKRERRILSPSNLQLTSAQAGPLAIINGYSPSSEPHRAVSPSPQSPVSSRLPPPLTAQDKAKFTRYFNSCNPVNGILAGTCRDVSFQPFSCSLSQSVSQGEKAHEVFVKSKLPVEKLSQIWCVAYFYIHIAFVLMYLSQESIGYS